jgi:hypothetical protein
MSPWVIRRLVRSHLFDDGSVKEVTAERAAEFFREDLCDDEEEDYRQGWRFSPVRVRVEKFLKVRKKQEH